MKIFKNPSLFLHQLRIVRAMAASNGQFTALEAFNALKEAISGYDFIFSIANFWISRGFRSVFTSELANKCSTEFSLNNVTYLKIAP